MPRMKETELKPNEERALGEFSAYLMTPSRMLCFSGPELEKHGAALETLSDKDLLIREKPRGAYSLTPSGYSAMKRACESP